MILKRVRVYATIIAVCLWSIWLIDMSRTGPVDRLGKIKGTDFVHFYVLGSIAHDGAWGELFDMRAQHARMLQIVPDKPDIFFLPIESPQSALLVAPLATLSYTPAFFIWTTIILATFAGCCWAMWREFPSLRGHGFEVAAASAAFPGLFSVVLHGQTAFVALACFVFALIALKHGRRFAAGFALGLLVLKPHWLVAACAVFLFAREWRVVAAAAIGAVAETAITWAGVGTSVMTAYGSALRALPRVADLLEPRPGDSLRGLFQVLAPSDVGAMTLYAAAAIAVLVIAAQIWRSDTPFEIRGASIVLATILVCAHVNAYDLVLLMPALFLIVSRLADSGHEAHAPSLPVLLVVLFFAPILTSLPALLRLQLSVTAAAIVLVHMWRIARGELVPRATMSLDASRP